MLTWRVPRLPAQIRSATLPKGSYVKLQPQTTKDRAAMARTLAMKGAANKAPSMKFVLPEKPTESEMAARDAQEEAAAEADPLVTEARKAAAKAFTQYDADQSGGPSPIEAVAHRTGERAARSLRLFFGPLAV